MSVSPDLYYQNFMPVQNDKQPTPMRFAADAANDTLAPTTALTVITSDNAAAKTIQTITPPVTGYHELELVGTNAAPTPLVIGGNIATAYTLVQNRVIKLHYDPVSALYYVAAVT